MTSVPAEHPVCMYLWSKNDILMLINAVDFVVVVIKVAVVALLVVTGHIIFSCGQLMLI